MAKKVKKPTVWEGIKSSLILILKSYFSKDRILSFIEKRLIKWALKKLCIVGGFKVWLITFIVGEIIEEADEHLIEPAFRKIGFVADKWDGQKIYKKVNNAQDVDTWRDNINNV